VLQALAGAGVTVDGVRATAAACCADRSDSTTTAGELDAAAASLSSDLAAANVDADKTSTGLRGVALTLLSAVAAMDPMRATCYRELGAR